MLYLAWDREINISFFFCDVFVWKWRLGHEQVAVVTMATRVLRPLKKAFLCIPLSAYCMQNLKGGWKFSFPKMFDFYRDLFLKLKRSAIPHSLFHIPYSPLPLLIKSIGLCLLTPNYVQNLVVTYTNRTLRAGWTVCSRGFTPKQICGIWPRKP